MGGGGGDEGGGGRGGGEGGPSRRRRLQTVKSSLFLLHWNRLYKFIVMMASAGQSQNLHIADYLQYSNFGQLPNCVHPSRVIEFDTRILRPPLSTMPGDDKIPGKQ